MSITGLWQCDPASSVNNLTSKFFFFASSNINTSAGALQEQMHQNSTRAGCQDSNHLPPLNLVPQPPCSRAALLRSSLRGGREQLLEPSDGLQSTPPVLVSLITIQACCAAWIICHTYTLSVKAGCRALRTVRITMMKMTRRKRARTAPMTAPATAMAFDLSAWDWPETEEGETHNSINRREEGKDSKASARGNEAHIGWIFCQRSQGGIDYLSNKDTVSSGYI